MSLVRARYADFGPTLAVEKLREVHDCRCRSSFRFDLACSWQSAGSYCARPSSSTRLE